MPEIIVLGWPDADTVTVHMDGKHVATMKNVEPEGIPTELFDLMRAAPDLLAALKHAADGLDLAQAQVDSENDAYTLRRHLVAAKRAINKAEGRTA